MAVRPRTLGAALVPVVVGVVVAARGGAIDLVVALATVVAALGLQIATNLANDFFDYERGVDTAERLGPMRVTQAGLLSAAAVRRGLYFALVVAIGSGGYLLLVGGWPIAVIGVASIVCAIAYSAGPWPLSWYGLGDAMAFAFFGVIAVAGTAYLQTGAFTVLGLLAGLPIACLVTTILVVNNLRDIPTDRACGKRTLAVRLGERATRVEYTLLIVFAFVGLIPVAALVGMASLLPLLAVPLAVVETRDVWRRTGRALNDSLIGTARLHLVFGLLFAAGLAL